ncbi:MAG: DUF3450 domain-containing protein [Gammaproteobacteria bacterium]|nr:DUF3450 domain-containing protein [Gammaproteobacteria bacterium]MDH3768209.1 DUF3450 domain-containing protein [Gammaproteobacteria bacterium]
MTRCRYLAGTVLLGLLLPMSALAQINQVLAQGEARANEGAQAQQRIEGLADQAGNLLNEYRTELKVVEGLEIYNGLLQRQIDNQLREKTVLSDSIGKVSLIERQIVPLMINMIDSLEEFIRLDVPFLTEERSGRIEKLRTLMERSDVTAAEQLRRVMEAYQIENEYGRTIEAYKGTVEVGGKPREVDFLRVGRISLMYQSVGGQFTGAYNKETGSFEEISAAVYKAQMANGLRIARKQKAPDLLIVPVPAAGGSR